MDDRLDEVINHRELPGEGEFDIPGYVAVAQDMGYPGPWGVEVLSEPLRNLPDRRDLRPRLRDDARAVRNHHRPEGAPVTDTVEKLDAERLIWVYTQMLRIREFEERVKRAFTDHPGVIRGHTHLADGAEASIVGSLVSRRDGDQLMATYRCHGYPLVLGTSPNAMMAEIFGREGGLCHGRGGSMHLTDVERGFMGTSGIVAAGIPQATGLAWAAQIRKQDEVVLCFFGDGASKQGAFAESLNIASLWKLPIVYVMENNGYNVVTQSHQEDANAAAGEPLAIKAKAFACPARRSTAPTRSPSTRSSAPRSRVPAREMARRWSSPRSTASPPTATSSPRPACRCTTPSTRRSRCSATPSSTRRRCAATPCRAFAGSSSPMGR